MSTPDLTPYRLVEMDFGTLGVTSFVDVTERLGTTEVKIEEEVNVIDRCTFRIVHDALFIKAGINYGMSVRITGGYLTDYPDNVAVLFAGIVTGWVLKLPDNGKPELEVTCEDDRAQMTLVKPGFVRYPSFLVSEYGTNANRPWVLNDPLKISDIVTNICNDYGIPINQIKILSDLDFSFSIVDADSLCQSEDETDFEFLHRLLTGVGKSKATGVKRGKRSLVSAQAVWFMEYDPVAQQSTLTVVPEADILQDTSPIAFRWQGEGFQMVAESDYDPTSQTAEMIMKGVTIRENIDQARAETTKFYKPVAKKQKGPKGAKNVGSPVRGALEARAAESKEFSDDPDVSELDTDAIKAKFANASDGTILAAAAGATRKDIDWAVRTKQTAYPAASRGTGGPGKGDDNNGLSDKPPTPGTPSTNGPGQKKIKPKKTEPKEVKWHAIGERIKKFGKVITFSCDGNIWIMNRLMYTVNVPADEYSGQMFCYKVTTILGKKFTQTLEMGR